MTQLTSGIQMDLVQIAHDYGWAMVALVLVTDKVFPFFARSLFPQMQKTQQAKLDAEKEEREFRHAQVLRQADTFDKLVETCQGIENFMASVDARLETIERQHGVKKTSVKRPRKPRVS